MVEFIWSVSQCFVSFLNRTSPLTVDPGVRGTVLRLFWLDSSYNDDQMTHQHGREGNKQYWVKKIYSYSVYEPFEVQ